MTAENENKNGGETLSRSERKRRFKAAQVAAQPTAASQRAPQVDVLKRLKKSVFLPLSDSQQPPRHRRGVVEYDGTLFSGFQAQEQRGKMRTVQEAIEDAIARTTGETVRVKGCSRTDKGVHARGQVIAFTSQCSATDRVFRDALNTRLPEDIVCHSLVTLPSSEPETVFDPRANSSGKIYEYVIVSGSVRPVLDRHHAWFMKKPLDTDKMKQAIAHLMAAPAARDFTAFTPPKSSQLNDEGGKGNMCTLFSVELLDEKLRNEAENKDDEDDTVRIRLRFHGDRFLYKMVRNLVGTLVDVGLGKLPADVIATLFETKNRSGAGQGAPPQGLTLVRVVYAETTSSSENKE